MDYKVMHLMKVAKGQVNGIMEMIEKGDYCIDISNQLLACASVLNKANQLILKNHLATCVKSAINENEKEKQLEELTKILEKVIK